MVVIPAMYLPFLMYAAWMGMVLRPFMQRVDDALETAALEADQRHPVPHMLVQDARVQDQTVAANP